MSQKGLDASTSRVLAPRYRRQNANLSPRKPKPQVQIWDADRRRKILITLAALRQFDKCTTTFKEWREKGELSPSKVDLFSAHSECAVLVPLKRSAGCFCGDGWMLQQLERLDDMCVAPVACDSHEIEVLGAWVD